MKGVLIILLLMAAVIGQSKPRLTGAQVSLVYSVPDQRFHVTERIHFDTIHGGEALSLKALLLSDTFHEESQTAVTNSGDAKVVSIIKSKVLQTLQVKFESFQKNGWIEVNYRVEKENQLTEIPLYFTDLSAASSSEDFFTFEMEIPEGQAYYFYFPTGSFSQNHLGNGKQLVSFSLPALPSMIRLELLENENDASLYVTLIDVGVAIVFLVIGILIYRYRNIFIYG